MLHCHRSIAAALDPIEDALQLSRYDVADMPTAKKMPKPRSAPKDEPTVDQEVIDITALGSLLRSRRLEASLSVRQAAEDAGVSFSTVTRVESGSQPDLATFLKLCAWLRVRPEQFFQTGGRRERSTVDAVVQHLYADPALGPAAAERIGSVVRDLYAALASHSVPQDAIACHLRAAPVMRAGVPEKLNLLLRDLHESVALQVRNGAL